MTFLPWSVLLAMGPLSSAFDTQAQHAAVQDAPAPPDPKTLLKTYDIDLDSPPEQRWVQAAKDHAHYLQALAGIINHIFDKKKSGPLVAALKKGLVPEYQQEMQGLAAAANITYDSLLAACCYYELTKVHGAGDLPDINDKACTSIVAQNDNGTMYLARNFDYPTLFSPLLVNARFTKGGKTAYEGTTVVGTIGLITGVLPGGFAVSIDARGHHDPTTAQQVKVAENGGFLFVHIARRAMDVVSSYEDAVKFYKSTPMIAPGYLIVGGSKPGEGAVVTTNSSAYQNDVWEMKDAEGWYILETNYDHWESPGDGRREGAKKSMNAMGSKGASFLGLWDVLSTPPVYRGATLSTHLVDIASGTYLTYLRHNIIQTPEIV